jgi:hypothetical protein
MDVRTTHFISPSETSLLLSESIVVLFADLVSALEDDKSSIIVATGCQVHETLDASETRSFGI